MSSYKINNNNEYCSADDKQYDDVFVVIDPADNNNETSSVRVDSDYMDNDVEVVEIDSEFDVDIIDVDIDAECDTLYNDNTTKEKFEDEETEFDSSKDCNFSNYTENESSWLNITDDSSPKVNRKKWSFMEDPVGNSILVLFVIFTLVFIIYLLKVFI